MTTSRALVALVVASTVALAAQQPPAFQGRVELLAVDVQVVDGNGRPVEGLGPEAFQVIIDGKSRRVVAAEFLTISRRIAASAGPTTAPRPAEPAAVVDVPADPAFTPFHIVVDCLSFLPEQTPGVVRAARQFVAALDPSERVGVFVYPIGTRLEPTTDRHAVFNALDGIRGQYASPPGNPPGRLSPQDVVDCTAASGAICLEQKYEEGQNNTSLGILGEFLRSLQAVPGRKALVMLSAGMVVGDRPGTRPDMGDRTVVLGKEAARANATVYTLFIDQSLLASFSASMARAPVRRDRSAARDSEILSRYLEQFSGAAGGTLFKVLTGDGEQAFARIIRETSAYYLLGVEPAESDRDGRPHEVRVRTAVKNTTVRSRRWVTVSP